MVAPDHSELTGVDPPELPSWDAAYERARATLAGMTLDEKYTLLHGLGYDMPQWWTVRKWWYVGNIAAIPRLSLPSLNMQDASGGFHTTWSEIVGTVTCWPSMLSMAATWDPDTVHSIAEAVGKEFAGKGANGILGPSVDVHRVARNGRNFEYLSGEDPFLGARLAEAYVKGVQSQGVFAVVKHWIFNAQETNRFSESSNVDDKTAWELYYPPFQSAVDAGVSAAMCSYNRMDGIYSCSNAKHIRHVLKGQMGFRGFVQSDWWAVHDTSIAQGLDQEMPGTGKDVFFTNDKLANESSQVVDEATTRILAVMHRMNLSGSLKCSPPHCESFLRRNVTNAAHRALARKVATESIVLLKNEADLLPLSASSVKSIALIGAAATGRPYNPNEHGQGHGDWSKGDYYSGGGSGHVVAGYAVTPLDGITRRARALGVRVVASPTNDVNAAVAAARQVDIAVIVAATTSGESQDRPNLTLDDNADVMIDAVARVGTPTAVLMQIPGAVVMPWKGSVASILAMFLGGQETGSAWAAALFGDHAPTGRLPIMMPATEEDTIPPLKNGLQINYDEGLETSYRNRAFKAAFPFGHGLTYTTFRYFPPSGGLCVDSKGGPKAFCIWAPIQNVGKMAGRTVVQLYLEMPAEAGHPTPLLKGFKRTGIIAPGAKIEVAFRLAGRSLAYYDSRRGDWREASNYTVHLGESSADIRQTLALKDEVAIYPHTRNLSPWVVGNASASGFCCFADAQIADDPCGSCEVSARAEPDSTCALSEAMCQSCSGRATWCVGGSAMVVMRKHDSLAPFDEIDGRSRRLSKVFCESLAMISAGVLMLIGLCYLRSTLRRRAGRYTAVSHEHVLRERTVMRTIVPEHSVSAC
jgi:beta-glucosidase